MPTISLSADRLNQMPGLLRETRRAVLDYKEELSALRQKTLQINRDICDLEETARLVQASTQLQEEKAASLEAFRKNTEQFAEEAARVDGEAAERIRQRKEEFYGRYRYLKPGCEQTGWEAFCGGCQKAGDWCREHWKLAATVALVIAALAVIVFTAGMALGPLALLLAGAAKGLLLGAIAGGLLGGLSAVAAGGSFWEGFEEGAFAGALSGALFGGMGAVGQLFGRAFGASCTVFRAVRCTALAVFTGSAYRTMKPMERICFVAGTLIQTAGGFTAIEQLRAGERVLSTDPETGELLEKPVPETYVRRASRLVCLRVGGETLRTTPGHPFYVTGRGFVRAGDLKAGERLCDIGGNAILLEEVRSEVLEQPVRVYNFQVADFHTYHVGRIGVLVHNAGSGYGEGESNAQNSSGVWTSKDPLVGDVANAIDDAIPGKVSDVNKVIRDSTGRIITDLDIELDNAVIQVKSGGGKGLTTQLKNTASATGKEAIGYVPDAKPSIIKGAEANGFKVFTDLNDLISYLKGN